MVHQASGLSPEQRAAAELLLGRPLEEKDRSAFRLSSPPLFRSNGGVKFQRNSEDCSLK